MKPGDLYVRKTGDYPYYTDKASFIIIEIYMRSMKVLFNDGTIREIQLELLMRYSYMQSSSVQDNIVI
jgi:hypothetical protein